MIYIILNLGVGVICILLRHLHLIFQGEAISFLYFQPGVFQTNRMVLQGILAKIKQLLTVWNSYPPFCCSNLDIIGTVLCLILI